MTWPSKTRLGSLRDDNIFSYGYLNVCIYLCSFVYICMYACILNTHNLSKNFSVCMYVCLHGNKTLSVCMYVCMYVCIVQTLSLCIEFYFCAFPTFRFWAIRSTALHTVVSGRGPPGLRRTTGSDPRATRGEQTKNQILPYMRLHMYIYKCK